MFPGKLRIAWKATSQGLSRRAPAAVVAPGCRPLSMSKDMRTIDQKMPLRVPQDARGTNLLHDPLWNKGTAHSVSERERLGLRGLLPPREMTMQQQV